MGAWQWNSHTGSVRWDSTFIDLLKAPSNGPGPTVKDVLSRIEPHDRRKLLQAVRGALSNAQALAIDVRFNRFDGRQRWLAARGAPMKADDGQVVGLVGIAYDVTAQKQNLSRTDALLREVSHRSKNMLALILAMARLTAREAVDVKSHLKDFALRVAGLAASQDLIVAADWQSVDLGALAFAEIEAVARTDAPRVAISGPSFLVTPEAAQTLGMILTELALNAIEHGALSTPGGEVRLSWEFPDDATIMISWHETGGPNFNPKLPKGYGMAVVERVSTQGLKVNAHIASDAGGFLWVLKGPIANIGMRPALHRT
jgi:two-component sensor histidine kinase